MDHGVFLASRVGVLGREVMCFLLFSGTAAAVNLATGYTLYALLGWRGGWRYGASVAVAFLVGMVVSFGLNRRFTFARSGRRVSDEVRTFFIVSIGGLLLTVVLSSLFRDHVLPWVLTAVTPVLVSDGRLDLELIAHLGAVGLVAVYSFLAHRHLSFGLGVRHVLRLGIRRGSRLPIWRSKA